MPLDQRSHSVGRDRTLLQPEVDALFVDLDDGRLGARIVMSEDFDERAVARRTRIGDHDAEERTLFGSCAAQTNGDHVTLLMTLGARTRTSVSLRALGWKPSRYED